MSPRVCSGVGAGPLSLGRFAKRADQLLRQNQTLKMHKPMNTRPDPQASPSPLAEAVRNLVKPFRFPSQPHEFKVVPLRECPTPQAMHLCDSPNLAADYWRRHVVANPMFNPETECLVVLMLNTRRRIKGHYFVSIGTADTLLTHPREIFRLAIMVSASAIILAHNHPSGDPTPSEADIRVTRDIARAGQLLKLELLDHIILGNPRHLSLRELGYLTL